MYGNVCWLLALPLCSCFSVSLVSLFWLLCLLILYSVLDVSRMFVFWGLRLGSDSKACFRIWKIWVLSLELNVVESENNNTIQEYLPFLENIFVMIAWKSWVSTFVILALVLATSSSLSCELCLVPCVLNKSWVALWWADASLLWVAIQFGSQLS